MDNEKVPHWNFPVAEKCLFCPGPGYIQQPIRLFLGKVLIRLQHPVASIHHVFSDIIRSFHIWLGNLNLFLYPFPKFSPKILSIFLQFQRFFVILYLPPIHFTEATFDSTKYAYNLRNTLFKKYLSIVFVQ